MEQLIQFLIRYGIYFLFVFLETISFIVIVNKNSFQHSAFFSSCNRISASVYQTQSAILEYFSLKEANRQLSAENAELRNRLADYKSIAEILKDSAARKTPLIIANRTYRFIPAKVNSNSVSKLQNYITLNKGSVDGVEPEMGVISGQGVVGVVKSVSRHFSTVMPLLNSQSNISSKVKRSNDFGQLTWDGVNPDYVQLEELSLQATIHVGDTLVTSGFSSLFPEGIKVGYVTQCFKPKDKSYYQVTARTAVTFRTLSYVQVVNFFARKEINELEKKQKTPEKKGGVQ